MERDGRTRANGESEAPGVDAPGVERQDYGFAEAFLERKVVEPVAPGEPAPATGETPDEAEPVDPREAARKDVHAEHPAPAPDHPLGAAPVREGSKRRASHASEVELDRSETRASTIHRLRDLVAKNTAVQLAGLGLAGVGMVIATSGSEGAGAPKHAKIAAPRVSDSEARPFPKLEVKGADQVKEEDVEAMFRAKKNRPPDAAREEVESANVPRDRAKGAVVLRPGELIDDTDASRGVYIPVPENEAQARSRPSASHAHAGHADRNGANTGRFFSPGGLLSGATSGRAASSETLNLKTGDRFKAKLEVGIVSSVREDVIASVVEDVVRSGKRVLKKGDMLRGRLSNDDKRVFIRFQSAETGSGSMTVNAYAVEKQMPGLRAKRREATLEERSRKSAASGAVAGVAREAGAILAQGSAAGRIAEGAANGMASEAQREMQPDSSWVLEVPAGRTFEVVVTEGPRP